MRAHLIGTGAYLPENVLTNADFERMVDTSDEWIMTRTGIRERHIAAPGQATSDMALIAAQRALAMADRQPSDIDMILVGTVTPDEPFPSAAALVQTKLGIKRCAVLDVAAGCTSFMYALALTDALIRAGSMKTVLVIGAEILSRITDYTDRSTCILFGDGAGACVFEAGDDSAGILSTYLSGDGSLANLLHMPGGGSLHPSTIETLAAHEHYIHMAGHDTFKHAVRCMEEAVEEAVQRAGLTDADIDFLVPHQANLRIIHATAKRLGLSMDRVMVTIERTGNTSSASVPMALDEGLRLGRIAPGHTVEMVAFGAGLTWGSAVVRLDANFPPAARLA